jgi:CBS domain-containing protein
MGETQAGTWRPSIARPRAPVNMFTALSAIMRQPLTVPLDATVRAALEQLDHAHADCVVATDRAHALPLGVFTLRDLVRRVTFGDCDLEQPIAAVMTSGLITLGPQATAHQAAITMARNGVRHVIVVDGEGRLAGIVPQDVLFAVQPAEVKQIAAEFQAARDVEAVRRAALGIRWLTNAFLAQGVSVETLTHYISTLNDLLTIRVIELTADEHDLPPIPMCWIALGSEGRFEQTFSTDQDNALVFEADDPEDARRVLLPFARAVNERLAACGFPLCDGDIMAGNPRWCLTLDEWRRTFLGWIDVPDPDALLGSTIFFDLRPIYGSSALAERLRDTLLAAAAERTVFLRHLAEKALQVRPPLGILRGFVTDRSGEFPHTLDLKRNGSLPFVDGARVLALAHRIPHTSTAERLRAIPDALLSPAALAAIVEAFYFVHRIRLRAQLAPGREGRAANRLDPSDLNDLDRHMLKESFLQARKLQGRLAVEYQLAF